MSALPPVHLCVVQPVGYVHSLGFLDPARYFRFQFRRLGAKVTIAKNRLRHDAVNLVFGSHLGFDAKLTERHACIFVNLEQLGTGGAQVTPEYLRLLGHSAVVDYDSDNVGAYTSDPDSVTVVPQLYAPYLTPDHPRPLETRPIDLLFIGSMNERRRAWLDRIEALGHQVSVFDRPLFGAERDHFISQSKAVLNVHFYETSRFEQVRVAHCLSLGTPVISERTVMTRPHDAFEDSVLWLNSEEELLQFFSKDFKTPDYFDAVRAGLDRFRSADPLEQYAELLAFSAGFTAAHHERRDPAPWTPTRINLGSGKDYQAGWLNLDVLDRAQPDLVLDLGQSLRLPVMAQSPTLGAVQLDAGDIELINANNVLEHVPDLPQLMSNCLTLLKTGGELQIEVPYERAPTAWQDPTHVRAMNENSWVYYTDWFWYLGWFDHRFEIAASTWLDMALNPCIQTQAAFMRVTLRKVETTLSERTHARTMQADLQLPDDEVLPQEMASFASPPAAKGSALPADLDSAVRRTAIQTRGELQSCGVAA